MIIKMVELNTKGGLSERASLYDKIGFKGLVDVVWRSAPRGLTGLLTFPYGLTAYYEILKESSDLDDLFAKHNDKYRKSVVFRHFRPRYHRAWRILKREYGIK